MEPLYNEVRGQTIFIIEEQYNMLVDNDKNKRETERQLQSESNEK
jgi:hypothetical protein